MLGYIKLSRSLKQTIKTSIKSNKQWFRVTAYTQPSKFCEHQLWRSVTVVQKVFTPHPVMLQSYSCRVFLALQPPFGSLLHKYNFGSYDFSRSAPRVELRKMFSLLCRPVYCAVHIVSGFLSSFGNSGSLKKREKPITGGTVPQVESIQNMTTAWFGDTLHQQNVKEQWGISGLHFLQ